MEAIATINSIAIINRPDNIIHRRIKQYKTRCDPFRLPEEDFKYKYRFSKNTAKYIINLVKDRLKKDKRGGGISPKLQVLTALRCWGRREVQDDSGDIHGLSQPTVSRVCHRVARALAAHRPTFVQMPSSVAEEEEVMNYFRDIANFPGVIGAIDCTQIRIRKSGGPISQIYINRKGNYSLNVQVICDATLIIRDVVARWRGSAHDSRIFNESTIKRKFENGQFRGRLIGDSGYPLLPFLFTPIRAENHQQERYNTAHIKTRNCIERCFGVWKQRFQCLLHGMPMSIENAKTTIVALAVLHNIAMTMNDALADGEDIVQPPAPEQQQIPAVEAGQGRAARRHARFLLNNFINDHF